MPQARRRGAQRSDLGARVAAGVPAALFAIFIVASGGPVFAAGAAVLGLICLHELYALYADLRPARLAGFLGLIGLVVAAAAGDTGDVLLVLAATVALVFLLTIAGPSIEGGTLGMAVVLLGVGWVGVGIAHAVLLRELPHGGGIVADVLVGTFVGDTGAYFGGRALGHRRLAPRLSPNKTVEGLLAGIATAILAVWIAGLYQDWLSGTDALLLGVGVALAAPAGDLFESFIKRSAGTKDTGRLFGAHGGALDRLDAILFTLVVGYYVWSGMV
ncbi:MAG TPA: phosphatidate cytidylyltransferase [Solirubrobacteraceae bacterium]|jgi:phosphatidate cytidylyltransferase|nr:phosphatidate cytidylyltransferase [Solirubrobacteraceae bacterium]